MNLAVSDAASGGMVMRLEGDFDLYSCAEVRTAVEPHITGGGQELFLDLGGVTFLDSSGLGTLVGLQKSANRAGTRLNLCRLPPQVQKILETTHLQDVFTTLPEAPAPGPSTPSAGGTQT
jgi:anti-anti-sigma factor